MKKIVRDFINLLKGDATLVSLVGHTTSDPRISYSQPQLEARYPYVACYDISTIPNIVKLNDVYETLMNVNVRDDDLLTVWNIVDQIRSIIMPSGQAGPSVTSTDLTIHSLETVDFSAAVYDDQAKIWSVDIVCKLIWRTT